MTVRPIAILWPDEGNYARFREISDDIEPDTLDEYRAAIGRNLEASELAGLKFERIEFDPEELLAFARVLGLDRVISQVRADYAAALQQDRQRAARLN